MPRSPVLADHLSAAYLDTRRQLDIGRLSGTAFENHGSIIISILITAITFSCRRNNFNAFIRRGFEDCLITTLAQVKISARLRPPDTVKLLDATTVTHDILMSRLARGKLHLLEESSTNISDPVFRNKRGKLSFSSFSSFMLGAPAGQRARTSDTF